MGDSEPGNLDLDFSLHLHSCCPSAQELSWELGGLFGSMQR